MELWHSLLGEPFSDGVGGDLRGKENGEGELLLVLRHRVHKLREGGREGGREEGRKGGKLVASKVSFEGGLQKNVGMCSVLDVQSFVWIGHTNVCI